MRISAKSIRYAICLFVLVCCLACAPGIRLNVQGTPDAEVAGIYTVIFYGCNFSEDPETVAFLDREGDPYTLEPYAPDSNYRVGQGVPAKDAFIMADHFLRCNTAFRGTQTRRIVGPGGETVGYEVRPFYDALVYGAGDVLAVDYWLKGDRVVAYIRLNPAVEHLLHGGSSTIED
jgi:hypothetical protein